MELVGEGAMPSISGRRTGRSPTSSRVCGAIRRRLQGDTDGRRPCRGTAASICHSLDTSPVVYQVPPSTTYNHCTTEDDPGNDLQSNHRPASVSEKAAGIDLRSKPRRSKYNAPAVDSVTHEIESIAAGTHGGDVQLSTACPAAKQHRIPSARDQFNAPKVSGACSTQYYSEDILHHSTFSHEQKANSCTSNERNGKNAPPSSDPRARLIHSIYAENVDVAEGNRISRMYLMYQAHES